MIQPQRPKRLPKLLVLTALTVTGCAASGSPNQAATPTPSESAQPGAQEEAEATRQECEEQLGDLIGALDELDSRLGVGLTFQEYGTKVGDARVAYDAIAFGRLESLCTLDVAVHLENALNHYVDAFNDWNDCIGQLGCSLDENESDLQAFWRLATRELRDARQGLSQLG